MLPPVIAELRASIGDFQTKMAVAREEMNKVSGHSQKMASIGKGALLGLGAAAVSLGAISIKMAGDFQQSMTQLVTGAGESEKNIKMVGSAILDLAGKVGVSANDLAKGMYFIESAGFHGAAGLNILKVAAEGAKVGNANMTTVADALTSALNAYREPASAATSVTNQLIAAVAAGKMHMEDLAGALGQVLPTAAALKIPLKEVVAAIATMTSQGTDASRAAIYMRFVLTSLANPTSAASKEMKALGISAVDVSEHIGQRGLAGTLEYLVNAIQSKMGPSGLVVIDTLTKAAGSTTKFQKALKTLTPEQQTYVGALAKMVGGTRGMQAALELTGTHMKTLVTNTNAVSAAARKSTGDVTGWGLVQQDFNQKLDRLGASLETVAIRIGNVLIPVLEAVVGWFAKHKTAVEALAIVIGGVLLYAIGAYIVSLAEAISASEAFSAVLYTLAGPFLPIIVALIAVGVAAYELVKHWKGFAHAMETAWRDVWHAIKTAFDDAWKFIKDHAVLIAGVLTGGIGAAIVWLAEHWKAVWRDIKAVAEDVWHALDDVWHGIETGVGQLVSYAVTGFRELLDVFLNVVGGILHGAAAAFGWIPGVGGKLKQARDAFDQFHADVDNTLSGIAADAGTWGQNIGNNLASGMAQTFTKVKHTAQQLASGISSNLKVASPAEEGPLSLLGGPEGWGARFVDLYGKGMLSELTSLSGAALASAHALTAVASGATGGSATPISGGLTIGNITIQIEGANKDPRALAIEVRDELLRLGKRNPTIFSGNGIQA